jgi:hypothetical protein
MPENSGVSLIGIQKSGPLDVVGELARQWMAMPVNPNGQSNGSILKPYWNGDDLTGRTRDRWLIDFPLGLTEAQAALYQAPFEFLSNAVYDPDDPEDKRTLKEFRAGARDIHAAERWWEPYWPRPEMRRRIESMERFIVTPETSEHRLFIWMRYPILPDKSLIIIGRSDDVTFGILQSHIHEVWSTRVGNRMGQGNQRRYNSSYVFDTFPFPERLTPDIDPDRFDADANAIAIGRAAKHLDDLREAWLNPPDIVIRTPEVAADLPMRVLPRDEASAAELRRRTLTDLYNEYPTWLQHAHHDLDVAVAAAYGWQWPLSDDEVLNRLFELNRERGHRS